MGNVTTEVMPPQKDNHMQSVTDMSLSPLLIFVLWDVLVCVCVFVWEDK